MFVVNEEHDGLSRDVSLLAVLHSVNEPMIAAADQAAEATHAFICTVNESGDKLRTHILFWLKESQKRVMYSWEGKPFPKDQRSAVEEEALDFVENMGFVMDNLNIHKAVASQRSELLDRLPIFSGPAVRSQEAELPFLGADLEELGAMEPAGESPAMLAALDGQLGADQPTHTTAVSDEQKSLQAMEQEFERAAVDFDEVFDSALTALASEPTGPTRKMEVQPTVETARVTKGSEEIEAWVRLMASF